MVNIMKYYYARVSTTKQNLSRQVELFKELGGTIRTIFEKMKLISNTHVGSVVSRNKDINKTKLLIARIKAKCSNHDKESEIIDAV